MKYVIYEIVNIPHLKEIVTEQYGYTKTLHRYVLETIDIDYFKSTHDSMEAAIAEIERHKEKFRGCELTILPMVAINFDYHK